MSSNLTEPMKELMQKLGLIINYLNYVENSIDQIISLEYLGKIDYRFIEEVLQEEGSQFYLKQKVLGRILKNKNLDKSLPSKKLEQLKKLRHMAAHSIIFGEPIRDDKGNIVDMVNIRLKKGGHRKSIDELVEEFDKLAPDIDAGLEKVFDIYPNVSRESFLPPNV